MGVVVPNFLERFMNIDIVKRARAPISAQTRAMLRHDLQHIEATAQRKNFTLDRWEKQAETTAGNDHFELGCWLFYYKDKIYNGKAECRIDCAKRIFEAGITNPRYNFFTVFEFGERQFDTLFEMGDSKDVIDGLASFLPSDTTGNLKKAFEYFGWPTFGRAEFQQAALF